MGKTNLSEYLTATPTKRHRDPPRLMRLATPNSFLCVHAPGFLSMLTSQLNVF